MNVEFGSLGHGKLLNRLLANLSVADGQVKTRSEWWENQPGSAAAVPTDARAARLCADVVAGAAIVPGRLCRARLPGGNPVRELSSWW
jgi:hypothetical protein